MKAFYDKNKSWLRTVFYIAGGALFGLAYYYIVGCSSGSCPITASPWRTMAYTGLMGFFLSGGFCSACSGGSCDLPSKKDDETDR